MNKNYPTTDKTVSMISFFKLCIDENNPPINYTQQLQFCLSLNENIFFYPLIIVEVIAILTDE